MESQLGPQSIIWPILLASRLLCGLLLGHVLHIKLEKKILLSFWLLSQLSCISSLSTQTIYYSKEITLHFNGSSDDIKITEFVRESEFEEVARIPYGNIEDLIGYVDDYRCLLNIFRQSRCDAGFHEFEGKLGTNPVFRRFDESDFLNSNCPGSYMQCVALWHKPDAKYLQYVNIRSTCYIYVSIRNQKPTRYRSGDTIELGSAEITFYFDCPLTEKSALANETHLFIGTSDLTVDITHGYLSKYGDVWKPNANLQVKPLGDLNVEIFSDFSYDFVLPNPYLKSTYKRMPLIGLINYVSFSDAPSIEYEKLSACTTMLSWSTGYQAETHSPSFIVYAVHENMTYDHSMNCTLQCAYSDRRKVPHFFNMINGVAHVYMQGIVLCDTGKKNNDQLSNDNQIMSRLLGRFH